MSSSDQLLRRDGAISSERVNGRNSEGTERLNLIRMSIYTELSVGMRWSVVFGVQSYKLHSLATTQALLCCI